MTNVLDRVFLKKLMPQEISRSERFNHGIIEIHERELKKERVISCDIV